MDIAGVISGALLYIRDDFKEVETKTWLQVMHVAHNLYYSSNMNPEYIYSMRGAGMIQYEHVAIILFF